MRWRYWVGLIGLCGMLFSCTAPPTPPDPEPLGIRSVDLSHVIRGDVPYWPAEPFTQIERTATGSVRGLTIGGRTGTLLTVVAAPEALVTIDLLSPRDLLQNAVVIDVRDQAQDTPGYMLTVADLLGWEARYGAIPSGTLVLLVTGWDVRWGDAAAYMALDAQGASQAPTLSPAAIDWLLMQRQVVGLGIDGPNLAVPATADQRLLLLNLTNLEQLPPTGTTLLIGALRVQAADRSPARVIALLP